MILSDFSQELFDKYQVRKTKKQKTDFINFMLNRFPAAKVERGGMMNSRNIVIGDAQNAEYIVTAHYDTCARLPFPNFIAPRNIPFFIFMQSMIFVLVVAIVSGLIIGLGYLFDLIPFFAENPSFSFCISLIISMIPLLIIFGGPANKHNANDNTSGVITLIEMMNVIPQELHNKVAFVFFDNEENGLVGASLYKKQHKNSVKNQLIINLDCVADGDNIMICVNKKANEKYSKKVSDNFLSTSEKEVFITKASSTIYPSDQMLFPCTIAIASLKKNKVIGYYMDKIHTNKDTNFDKRNIKYLRDTIINFMK